jgi:HEXXH motif-containing protein
MTDASAGEAYARQYLASITAHRVGVTDKLLNLIASVFPDLNPDPPLVEGVVGYALAHHAIEGIREGARARNSAVARRAYTALAVARGRQLVTASHASAIELTDLSSEMPVWAVSAADVDSAPADVVQLTERASAAALDAGYGWLVRNALGVVVTLHQRRLDEATSSWTVSRLPCTIYTDYYMHGTLLGKDLVHEAAHSWLNDCLTVTSEELDDSKAEYWSPWKQRNRTAFGIVHSAFAFSCVINYLGWLRDQTPDPDVLAYCERRLPSERARLAEAASGIELAFKAIAEDPLRNMLRAEFASAMSPDR